MAQIPKETVQQLKLLCINTGDKKNLAKKLKISSPALSLLFSSGYIPTAKVKFIGKILKTKLC